MGSESEVQAIIDDEKNMIFNYTNSKGEYGIYLVKPLRIKEGKRSPLAEVIYKRSKIRRAPDYVEPNYATWGVEQHV